MTDEEAEENTDRDQQLHLVLLREQKCQWGPSISLLLSTRMPKSWKTLSLLSKHYMQLQLVSLFESQMNVKMSEKCPDVFTCRSFVKPCREMLPVQAAGSLWSDGAQCRKSLQHTHMQTHTQANTHMQTQPSHAQSFLYISQWYKNLSTYFFFFFYSWELILLVSICHILPTNCWLLTTNHISWALHISCVQRS